jgi:hypothetical protein
MNGVVTCRSDGSGYGAPSACGADQTCLIAQGMATCKDHICTPSVVACDTQSEKVIACAADGLSSTTKVDCGAMGQVCVAASCVPVVCTAGKQYCDGNIVKKCSAKGDTSTVVQACSVSQYCDAATVACKALVCTPNMPACNGTIATTCNSDGSGYVAGGTDCSPKSCGGGVCVTCDPTKEVAYNGHCYYLDGSGGLCDTGYAKAPESVMPNIASGFAGKTYKHTVSNNCCVDTSDTLQHWGMMAHCNTSGLFSAGEPLLGGSNCNGGTPQHYSMQLTLCGSL